MSGHTQKALNAQIINQLNQKLWTIEKAINILATIQFNRLERDTFTTIILIGKMQELSAKFIYDGIKDGVLHTIPADSAKENLSNIGLGVVGGFDAGSFFLGECPILMFRSEIVADSEGSVETIPVLMPGDLAAAEFNFLPSEKEKTGFRNCMLEPMEVVTYAQAHQKWINSTVVTQQPEDLSKDYSADSRTPWSSAGGLVVNGALPSEPLSRLTAVGNEKPKRGKQGADARWKERDELVRQAEKFMIELIKMDCLCSHEKLATITYELGKCTDGKPFKDCDRKNFGLYGSIKKRAKSLVPEERRFGNTQKHNPEACRCPITDHHNFKLPRYRE